MLIHEVGHISTSGIMKSVIGSDQLLQVYVHSVIHDNHIFTTTIVTTAIRE